MDDDDGARFNACHLLVKLPQLPQPKKFAETQNLFIVSAKSFNEVGQNAQGKQPTPQRDGNSKADFALCHWWWGLSPENDLGKEAIKEAVEVAYGSTKARIVRAEHLIAIKLKVGRPRDLAHVNALLQQAKIDHDYLRNILERHGLTEKWQAFQSEAKTK